VAEETIDNIVELALAIVDEETRAWLTLEQEIPQPVEGSSDAR
jgi:hypothetical protein